MTVHSSTAVVPAWAMATTAMLSVQLGSALSVGLTTTIGPAGTAWLRTSAGAVILLVVARPPVRAVRRHDVPVILGLGIVTGLVTMSFLAAIARIPLGTAVAIEFLGPLTLAALRGRTKRGLVWPAAALIGVALLTEPWRGTINATGVGFAVLAAVGWATYIQLTQRVGERFSGIGALALTVPIAAVTAAVIGVPEAAGRITIGVLAAAFGIGLLHPVLPFALEMLALRRMRPAAFATLMAVEPAFGVLIGLIALGQKPSVIQTLGILLVVLAGTGAQRLGPRHPHVDEAVVAAV